MANPTKRNASKRISLAIPGKTKYQTGSYLYVHARSYEDFFLTLQDQSTYLVVAKIVCKALKIQPDIKYIMIIYNTITVPTSTKL